MCTHEKNCEDTARDIRSESGKVSLEERIMWCPISPIPSELTGLKSHRHVGAKSETEPCHPTPNALPFDDSDKLGQKA